VKKITSICLLVLLLLNVMGYYGVFMGLRYKNTLDVAIQLDADDYDESEVIVIKVPLSVPYMENTDFERVSGEIEHKGEFYNLVKQKLSNDTLFVVCVKNQQRKHIEKALEDYVKTFTDKASEPGHQAKLVPSFIKDFLPTEILIESSIAGWSTSISFGQIDSAPLYPDPTTTSPPPKA
jgi:hypothetical protein